MPLLASSLRLPAALLLLCFPADGNPSGSEASPSAPQAVPSTDIWIFPLGPMASEVDGSGGVRVTQRPGYDNQPHFYPGGGVLYYTAIDESGQADIWSYGMRTGERMQVTRTTPESEYSATTMPSGTRFSAIRVEADSTQRLWSFDLAGGTPALVLESIAPVGYHAWIDEDRVALFVLGSPATLQMASVAADSAHIVASDIGRSLYKIPRQDRVSFVQWTDGADGWITAYDPATDTTRPLAPLLEGNEYYAWSPDGVLLMGLESRLYRWVLGRSGSWEEIADLAGAGIGGISRIAVSPDGDWIAVVAREG